MQHWFATIQARPVTVRAYEKAEALKTERFNFVKSRDLLFNHSANTVKIQLLSDWC
ncbi:hypothetical protein NWP27_03325 [Chrysosporum ovalisporum TAC611]|nr:hypothetical protein [Umezakia ovalisporum]MDH6083877.1 hypothetical protein [Umezakia ovalisporum TAC611]